MGNKVVTHPVKRYIADCWSDEPLGCSTKFRLLRKGISDLINIGRSSVSVKFGQYYRVRFCIYHSYWIIDSVYIGRKSVLDKNYRTRLRKFHKDFNNQPVRIPYA